MNAVVMDEAEVVEQSIVAACAFVPAGMRIPPRTLVEGMPANVKRELSEAEIAWKIQGNQTYQDLTLRCLATMQRVKPLFFVEPDRPQVRSPLVKSLTETKRP